MMRLAIAFAATLVAPAAQRPEAPAETLAAIQRSIEWLDIDGARGQLDAALLRYPSDGRLFNLAGIIAAQSNDYTAAESAFKKAVRLAPQLTGAWLNLGRLYQTHIETQPGAADKGIEVYRRVLAASPGLPEAHYQLALLLQSRGAYEESLQHLEALPPDDRDRTGALALRCAAEAGSGKTAAAIAAARRLLDRPGLEEADVLAILPGLRKTRRDETIRVLLEGLVERRLASGTSRRELAAVYERSGDLVRARTSLESAAQESPGETKPLLDLARIAWKQRDYEGTLGYLAHARDLDPKNPAIHFLFGLAANELHLAVEARQSLQKAIELAPDQPYYNYALGVVSLQWSDKQPALGYLRKYTAVKPDDPRGRLALATAHFLLYDFDAAKAEALRIANEPAFRAAAQYLLGCIARENGELDPAVAHLETALRLAPGLTEAHAELAAVLVRKEDYLRAEREARIALSKDPDGFAANQTLMQIYRNAHDPRAEAQAERLKNLVEDRNRKMQLMLRTIEVKPY